LLTAHYRETFNFTVGGLEGARTSLSRIDECLGKLREIAGDTSAPADSKLVQQFTETLDEDLNISGAWGVVFEWVRDTNRRIAENVLKPTDAAAALAAFEKIDSVLGIGTKTETEAPAEIIALADARTAAKKAKDFKKADAIREELKAKGWAIEDTPKG